MKPDLEHGLRRLREENARLRKRLDRIKELFGRYPAVLDRLRQAEKQLAESEAMFRTLAEQSPSMILISSKEAVVYANDRCEQMLGYSRNDICRPGFDLLALMAPEDREKSRAHLERLAEGEGPSAWECALMTRDGRRLFTQINGRRISFQGEQAILLVVTDITRLKRTEEQLRHILASTPAVHYVCRWDGVRWLPVFISPNLKAVFGHAPEAVLGDGEWWWKHVHPEERERVMANFKDALASGAKRYVHEYRFRKADGEWRWVHDALNIVRDDHGRPREIVGSWLDVSERRAMEEALQRQAMEAEEARQATLLMLEDLNESRARIEEAKRQWEATFDAVTEPVFVHDEEGGILRANRAYAKAAGCKIDACIGRPYWQVFPKQEGPLPSCRRAMEKGKEEREEEEVRTDDGRIWRSHAYALRDARGRPFAVHFMHDETETVQARQALAELSSNLKQLMDRNSEGIIVVDGEGRIQEANPAAIRMLEKDRDELIGSSFFGLPLAEGETEMDFRTSNQGVRRIMLRSAPGRWLGKQATFVWLHDRTEEIAAAEALRASHVKLRSALEGTIQAIATAVEARDPYTAGHQRRVAELAAAIADEMGLDLLVVEGIHLGAQCHDLGKIHIPAEILAKPTRLTKIEYELIKTHPQVGYDILKAVDFPWPVADIAHQHHERLDGSGYPQGLKGDGIRLEARIVAVADVVEAMASHRPYRAGLGMDRALAEIERGRGSIYDADAVDACLRLFRERKWAWR